MSSESPQQRKEKKGEDEMESLELSPIGQEQQQEDLEVACQVIQELIGKYGSEQTAFDRIDSKGEGQIGIDEFANKITEINLNESEYKIQSIFQQFDTNGDGIISKEDWKQAFLHLPQKLALIQQNSVSHNSDINHIVEQKDLKYLCEDEGEQQINNKPEIELKAEDLKVENEISSPSKYLEKLSNSNGLEGLVRKFNALKVHAQAQLEYRQQQENLASSFKQGIGKTPGGRNTVTDRQVQSIFGNNFPSPSKVELGIRNKAKEEQSLFLSNGSNSSQVFGRKIKNQKDTPLQNDKTNSPEENQQQAVQVQPNLTNEKINLGTINSVEQNQENLQSSLKRDILGMQQSQQQPESRIGKPRRDLRNNFQSYLSIIGLGTSRTSQLNPSNNSNSLNRVSSSERYSSFKGSYQQPQQPQFVLQQKQVNLQPAQSKRKSGLEGIIDQINHKKFSSKQNNSISITQPSQSSFSASGKLLKPKQNANSSKQADIEGSLEKFRLLSLQRSLNYSSHYQPPKENIESLKISTLAYLKSHQQPQQQQQPQSQVQTYINFNRSQSPPQTNNSSKGVSTYCFGQRQSTVNSNSTFSNPIDNRKSLLIADKQNQKDPIPLPQTKPNTNASPQEQKNSLNNLQIDQSNNSLQAKETSNEEKLVTSS